MQDRPSTFVFGALKSHTVLYIPIFVANKAFNKLIFPEQLLLSDYISLLSLFFRLILSRIIQHILACLHTAHRKTGKVEKSLLPANSLLWAKYFENNNDLALCTSSISSSSSLGGDIRDCRPFELLVDKRSAKIPPCCFSQLVPGAISGFKMVSG